MRWPARRPPDETIAEIVTGWDEITEELGKDDQQAAYKATLGVTK